MGITSYLTSDTQESIRARVAKSVYMLQPNGLPPIREDVYDGYGNFGGVNCFNWLVEQNAEAFGIDIATLSEDALTTLGVGLDIGSVLKVRSTGEILNVFFDYTKLVGGHYLPIAFSEIIPGMRASANDLIESGDLIECSVESLLNIEYPLKFSFDPGADYDQLPAAKHCPDQGFLDPL